MDDLIPGKKTSVEPVVCPYKTSYFYTKKSKFKHFVVKSAWENVIKVPAEGFALQVFPQFFPERENCYVGTLCLCGRYTQRIRRRWAFNSVTLQSVKTCTGWPRSYRKYKMQITQPSQYRYAKLQYRFAVTSGSPSTCLRLYFLLLSVLL